MALPATQEAIGAGTASLFMLPGLLCDSRLFKHQVEALGAHSIDDHYGSAKRIEAMAEYALQKMPERCALLGHSMGGRVALEVWRRAPKRIERLALMDTGVHAVRPGEAEARLAIRDLGLKKGDAALVDTWLPPLVSASHLPDATLMAGLREMALDAGTQVYSLQIEALLSRPAAVPTLSTISCPTFVIVGEHDQWSPVEQHAEIARAIPGAELRVIARAGHMAPAEEPGQCNQVIREWLWAGVRNRYQKELCSPTVSASSTCSN